MGGFLDKPKTVKYNEHGEGLKLRYGISSMQGWRSEMEDAHYAHTSLGENLNDWSSFAVFDGHAGHKVSEHCSRHLLDCILQTEEFKNGEYEKGIRTGFLRIDEIMLDLPELGGGSEWIGGTTAVCAFISSSKMYIANCGDSRAVLCRNGVPVFATQDHKPELPKESERIRKAGGSVTVARVNGRIAVSRALGDYDFKLDVRIGQCEQLVSPEPEVFCQERDDSDQFLVLACDGVWDVMSNEELCSFISSRLKITDDLETVANQVIDTCLHMGSRDNMSIIIVAFAGAPKPTEEAREADRLLDLEIEKLAREVIKKNEYYILDDVSHALQSYEIKGLPPGGGLHSKYGIIEKLLEEIYPAAEEKTETPN